MLINEIKWEGIVFILNLLREEILSTYKDLIDNGSYICDDGAGYRQTASIADGLNCHFIFNAFNTLKYSVISGKSGTCGMIDDLAGYMRYRIDAMCGFERVPFREEIKYVKSYINLEMARFSRVNAEYNLEDTDFTLPSMSVIFLAENAIHHGILMKKEQGHVWINSYYLSGFHCIEVCDDGAGMVYDGDYPCNGKGIGNLPALGKRIEDMAGGMLVIKSQPGQGTRALIKIPADSTDR